VNAVGFAVAGGVSLRMGRDKALLPWGETDLLGHALARLARVSSDVRILCGAAPRYDDRGFPVVTDAEPGLGPLAGAAAALEAAGGRPALLLAIDLPGVPAELLAGLASRLAGFDAVVPFSPAGPEPLCAVYGPACLEAARACLGGGRLAMRALLDQVSVRTVPPAELSVFGDPAHLFVNLNEPGDYERLSR
jgi:molybdopterin-guanine dinucleotide biosynthesis protein A